MVPFLLILLPLSVGAAWATSRYQRCERARERADRTLKRWVERLIDGEGRLLALENKSTLVMGLADPMGHFRGQSQKTMAEIAEPIDDLFMCHAAAERLLEEARADVVGIGFLGLNGYERALRRLEVDEVVVSTDDVKERRLFQSEKREFRERPPDLWKLMDRRFGEASAKLDTLKAQIKESWDGIDRLLSLMAKTEVAETTLHERDLDPEPYANSRFALTDNLNELRQESQFDPLGVADTTAQIDGAVNALRERLDRVDQALTHLEELPASIEAVESQLEERRAAGMRLIEPGFEPEVMIDQAEENAASAWEHLRDGGDRSALEYAAEASDTAKELSRLVEVSLETRESGKGRITTAKERLKRLRKELPVHRSSLDELVKTYSKEALQPALTNFEQASTALTHAEHCLADAASAIKSGEQRYLAGDELIRRATAALDALQSLYTEIKDKAAELEDAREGTEEMLEELRETIDDIRGRIQADASFASSWTVSELASLTELVEEAESQAKAERPNWLALEHRAEILEPLAMELAERATAEQEARDQFDERIAEAEKRRDQLAALLKDSKKSRPLANRALETSTDEIQWIRTRSTEDRPDWVELLAGVEAAIAHLSEGKSLAEAGITTAATVRQAVASAAVAIRSADRSYGYGVRAHLEMARAELMTARTALKKEGYRAGAQHAAESMRRTQDAETRALAVIRTKEAQAARRSLAWSPPSPRLGSFRSSSLRSASRSSFGSSAGRSSFSGAPGSSRR